MSGKICGYCMAHIAADQEYCSVCGKRYTPLVCNSCRNVITSQTKFCPRCGKKVRTAKDEKKKKKGKIIAFILVIAVCLILFVPYERMEDCRYCSYGEKECPDKKAGEYLSGKKDYNHDCSLCENGKVTCDRCYGEGWVTVTTNNFNELFN
jgi:RNA polymerase subunit RPABC4/transcription elongation factor Spt4